VPRPFTDNLSNVNLTTLSKVPLITFFPSGDNVIAITRLGPFSILPIRNLFSSMQVPYSQQIIGGADHHLLSAW
jgi:hypothetical protein